MFKMASICVNASLEMSSFVSRRINDCMLYARSDHTQSLLQLLFQMFKKYFKVVFFHYFVLNPFIMLLAP